MDALFEAVLEVFLEITLMPLEPVMARMSDIVCDIIDNKIKKSNRRLRKIIRGIADVLQLCAFFGLIGLVVYSYIQKAGIIPPKYSAVFWDICIAANTLYLAYAAFFAIFHLKDKKMKYLAVPVTIIVFILNILILLVIYLPTA